MRYLVTLVIFLQALCRKAKEIGVALRKGNATDNAANHDILKTYP